LLKRNLHVRCLVRKSHGPDSWLSNLPIEPVLGDLRDPASLQTAVRDVDIIIHVAGITKAKRSSQYVEGNVLATKNLLEAASKGGGLKKFCYVSSLTAVGPSLNGMPLDESSRCNPISAYGRSKLEAERLCHQWAAQIPTVILRPPAVYGPRDKDGLEIFRVAKIGIQPVIGSREQTLSLIYGPDLAEAIVEATLSDGTTGKTYFAADPVVYRQSQIFRIISDLVGKKSLILRVPSPLVYSLAGVTEFISFLGPRPAVLSIDKARDLLQKHWVCSSEKLKMDIGFETKTPAEEGLRQTYTWYRQNKWL
jgi:dihydroflavonol-4-reductase